MKCVRILMNSNLSLQINTLQMHIENNFSSQINILQVHIKSMTASAKSHPLLIWFGLTLIYYPWMSYLYICAAHPPCTIELRRTITVHSTNCLDNDSNTLLCGWSITWELCSFTLDHLNCYHWSTYIYFRGIWIQVKIPVILQIFPMYLCEVLNCDYFAKI